MNELNLHGSPSPICNWLKFFMGGFPLPSLIGSPFRCFLQGRPGHIQCRGHLPQQLQNMQLFFTSTWRLGPPNRRQTVLNDLIGARWTVANCSVDIIGNLRVYVIPSPPKAGKKGPLLGDYKREKPMVKDLPGVAFAGGTLGFPWWYF